MVDLDTTAPRVVSYGAVQLGDTFEAGFVLDEPALLGADLYLGDDLVAPLVVEGNVARAQLVLGDGEYTVVVRLRDDVLNERVEQLPVGAGGSITATVHQASTQAVRLLGYLGTRLRLQTALETALRPSARLRARVVQAHALTVKLGRR